MRTEITSLENEAGVNKKNNLIMTVIDSMMCSSSRSCVTSTLRSVGVFWCQGCVSLICICVHWQSLNLFHSSVWWGAGPAEGWHSRANKSHNAVKEWKNAGIYRKGGMVRLREEKLVNRALAGWIIRCTAGTHSPWLFFISWQQNYKVLCVLQNCNFLRRKVLPVNLVVFINITRQEFS